MTTNLLYGIFNAPKECLISGVSDNPNETLRFDVLVDA
jgi:hypothetical protein